MLEHRQAVRPIRWIVGTVLAAFLVSSVPVRADLIFLKDGTVLQGTIKRESKLEVDAQNPRESFIIPTGHYWVDDGPRKMYFSQGLVGTTEKKVAPAEERITHKNKSIIRDPAPFVSLDAYIDEPAWSDDWDRMTRLRIDGRPSKMGQCISTMTPYWTRVDATTTYFWAAGYMTRELGLDTVRRLINAHPDFEEKLRASENERALKRFRYVDFFTQAGWYGEAEGELERIHRELPAHKEKAEAGLKALRTMMARDKYEEIKRLHLAGQYDTVRRRIAAFPVAWADAKIEADLVQFKQEYDGTFEKVAECRNLLEEFAKQTGKEDRGILLDAARTIARDLHPGSFDRLETFLSQAKQAVRQKAQGKTPDLTAEQVLSLGISGWLLGSAAAESKVDTGVRLWRARELALEVMRSTGPAQRTQLITAYGNLPQKDQAPHDWFVQMIPSLPPPFPEQEIGLAPKALTLGDNPKGGGYVVQLPREYRHSQSYPVLVVLHDAGEKPEAMLERWAEALEHGYILLAPAWEAGAGGPFGGGGGIYTYSPAEHEAVLASLRDLRKRFNVDSDRVFLTGLGHGGTMAFDVGLSHPDQFAGVIPMSATPDLYCQRYWKNAMYLPFYVVGGERMGEGFRKTKALFDIWILRSQPALWVQYKGRGAEWFAGEVPLVLDWMRAKRRVLPLRKLGDDAGAAGAGMEFQILRPTDNRFYWVGCDQISPRRTTPAVGFDGRVLPATLTARVDADQNRIVIRGSGMSRLTIWLARNSKGESTVDFERNVMVQVGLNVVIPARKVVPSLAVLLEDLAQRGDRQQLFLAKIELAF